MNGRGPVGLAAGVGLTPGLCQAPLVAYVSRPLNYTPILCEKTTLQLHPHASWESYDLVSFTVHGMNWPNYHGR